MIQWKIRRGPALSMPMSYFKAIKSRPADCRMADALGDGMAPYILDGDVIMIDTRRTRVRDGGIYAVCFENETLVKQLFKGQGGALTLRSMNDKHPDRSVKAEDRAAFHITGEIVYRSGRGLNRA